LSKPFETAEENWWQHSVTVAETVD